jgi:hypothetical protein
MIYMSNFYLGILRFQEFGKLPKNTIFQKIYFGFSTFEKFKEIYLDLLFISFSLFYSNSKISEIWKIAQKHIF